MIDRIVMPSMGATGEDVVIAEWLVKEGDFVKEGQQIFVAETDKATTEVEAFRAGYIRKILVQARESAALGDALAIIADSLDEPLEETAVERRRRPSQFRNRPAAAASITADRRLQASPLARRLAKERGIDLATVKADGPIHKRDVLNCRGARQHGRRAADGVFAHAPSDRRANAAEQDAGAPFLRYCPHRYDRSRCPATETRRRVRRAGSTDGHRSGDSRRGDGPARNSPLNASCQDNQIVQYDDINIGLVIGLPEGMMIPVIKQADTQDLYRLAATTKRLRDQALAGTLAQADLTQGTFTISNLGMFGVESFIAVINPPEAGILALGRFNRSRRSLRIALLSAR